MPAVQLSDGNIAFKTLRGLSEAVTAIAGRLRSAPQTDTSASDGPPPAADGRLRPRTDGASHGRTAPATDSSGRGRLRAWTAPAADGSGDGRLRQGTLKRPELTFSPEPAGPVTPYRRGAGDCVWNAEGPRRSAGLPGCCVVQCSAGCRVPE
ncbi:hypothetical protein Asp14428_26390 [Actinoplanes sp. NBRC 14428]|nr:hypothetical protein Asp14428_26390 [Actinoplanes sp. NBRC 14428]